MDDEHKAARILEAAQTQVRGMVHQIWKAARKSPMCALVAKWEPHNKQAVASVGIVGQQSQLEATLAQMVAAVNATLAQEHQGYCYKLRRVPRIYPSMARDGRGDGEIRPVRVVGEDVCTKRGRR